MEFGPEIIPGHLHVVALVCGVSHIDHVRRLDSERALLKQTLILSKSISIRPHNQSQQLSHKVSYSDSMRVTINVFSTGETIQIMFRVLELRLPITDV